MANTKETQIIYLAQLEGNKLAQKREALRVKLDYIKKIPHDKKEYKKQKAEIIREMNALTCDMDSKMDEMYRQNYEVVKQMLMMFVGMDFITRLYDKSADTFKAVTVGIKRDELLDFTKMCREVANKANEVVRIIDEAGKDMMSMAYADMEDTIGEDILHKLEDYVVAYSKTPQGRKYFYGDH